MNDNRFPKTTEAIDFASSFGNINRIITVFGIIDMHIEDESSELVVHLTPSGKVKESPTLSDVIAAGDKEVQAKWKAFVLRNSRIRFRRMTEELKKWIGVLGKEEGNEIIKMIEGDYEKIKKELTQQNILSKIIGYNKSLKSSKIQNKELLEIPTKVGDYMDLIEGMFENFEYHIQEIKKVYDRRIVELMSDNGYEQQNREVTVDHRLRWNENEDAFEDFFGHLIDNKSITLASGEEDPDKIMEILKLLFEVIEPPKTKGAIRAIHARIPLDKKPFTISDQLVWTRGNTAFTKEIAPLVKHPKTVFIEKFDMTERGETPDIARILHQVFLLPKDDGSMVTLGTLTKYLRKRPEDE